MLPPGFQPAVVASRSVPEAALVSTQSASVTVAVLLVPSEYPTVNVPVVLPYAEAPMTPSTDPVPASAIVWPSATTLSGSPGATSGQVIVMPSCSSDWPGTSASSARPEAENESPMPS